MRCNFRESTKPLTIRAAWNTAAVLAFGAAVSVTNAGTPDTFKTGGSLTTAAGYNSGMLPGNTTDVTLTTSTTALTITASALTMESLSATNGTSYTISNSTSSATNSTLTLGNSAGFTNSTDGVANDLIDLSGSGKLTINGPNAGSPAGAGTLGIVLASSGNFDVGGTATLTISANISQTGGAQSLTISGASTKTVVLSGTNTFSGGLVVTNVETDVPGDSSLGAAGGSVTINGGRLGFTATTTIDPTRAILLGANPTGNNKAGSLSVASGFTATYNGSIQNLNANTAGDLVRQASGTLQLGGVSTYSGGTFLSNGTTQLTTGNNRLPTGTTVSLGQGASTNLGIFDLNGQNQQVAGLNSVSGTNASTTLKNTVTVAGTGLSSILTLGGSGSYAYGDGTAANSGVITGAVSINKTGTGTQTFGDNDTYSGSTTVSAGTLIVGTSTTPSAKALGGTSAVFVNDGGTLQMGAANQFAATPAPLTMNGTTAAAATFSVNGNSQGSTTANGVGALTLASTSANNVVDFNSKNGVVTFTGLTTNGATLIINNYLNNSGTSGGPDELIFNQDETSNLNNIVFTGYGNSNEAALGNGFYEIFPSASAVPEPATVFGGFLMVGLLAWNQRRRLGGMVGLA